MKKLMMCLVMLAMLGVCSSSFGDFILLYNLTASGSGVDVSNGDSAAKITVKAYFVLRLNDALVIQDANFIMYGKDSNTPKAQKVYVELNRHDANGFLSNLTMERDGDFRVIDFVADNGPFNFEGLMLGKTVPVGAVDIVTKAKGAVWVRDGMLLGPADQDVTGTGTLSASLDLKNTKGINGLTGGPKWNQDEVVVTGKDEVVGTHTKHFKGIREILEAKGYHRFSPAP